MNPETRWSPYLAGSLTGLLLAGSAWLTGKMFGSATSFVRTTGMIENKLNPHHVAKTAYFDEIKPVIDWQWMFVIGIALGSFISAITSGGFKVQALPDMWAERFGPSKLKRAVAAFLGGIVAMFGVRMAGGCPSGQMSNLVQLSVSSLLAIGSFFIGGIVSSRLIYGGGE